MCDVEDFDYVVPYNFVKTLYMSQICSIVPNKTAYNIYVYLLLYTFTTRVCGRLVEIGG